MKASTKTSKSATVTAAPAAKASAKVTSKTIEVQTVKVPEAVTSAVSALASNEAAVFNATAAREQTIVNVGDKVKVHLGKNPYDVTFASLKPVFYEAAKASNPKAEDALKLYTGQQLSRVMLLAYPGGKDATPKQREQQTAEIEKGKKLGLGQVALFSLAKKGARVIVDKETKKPTVVTPQKDNRGGANKKAPIDSINEALGTIVNQAVAAKIDREQILTMLAAHFVAAEMMTEDESLEVTE
jgi:hypothetical protein